MSLQQAGASGGCGVCDSGKKRLGMAWCGNSGGSETVIRMGNGTVMSSLKKMEKYAPGTC